MTARPGPAHARQWFTLLPSPVGTLLLARSDAGLTMLRFENDLAHAPGRRDDAAFGDEAAQLAEYFAGERRAFDLVLAPHGTPFQLRVWRALETIPFGETTTYGAIARAIGAPAASRAVGAANGRNPIAIVVPCHRVIGSSGALVGFGGGLPRKRTLLELEARYLRRYTLMMGTPSCVSTKSGASVPNAIHSS